jgi:hypothetical protein
MSKTFSRPLTSRLAAMAQAIDHGESNQDIADALGVSRQAVDKQRKLGLVERWKHWLATDVTATATSATGSSTSVIDSVHVNPYSTDRTSPTGLEASAAKAPPRSWAEKTALVVEAIEESGVSRRAAAAIAGIPESSFYLRMTQDEEFRAAVFQAEANLEAGPAKNLKRLAESDKQGAHIAAAIYLERRFPRDWAKRDHLDVEVNGRIENVNIETVLRSSETIVAVSRAEMLMQQDEARLDAHDDGDVQDADYVEVEVPPLSATS